MKKWVLVAILLLGLFLRVYKPLSFYMYGHDQDLAGWVVKDILVNHHIRLIGQETSSQGIFIGPLFYYLQIPFYIIGNMDPAGTLALTLILGVFTIYSFYYVFSKVFGKRAGVISALVYAASTVIVFTDRDVVPTMPVMLWTVWYFYGLWSLLKGNQKAYFLIGILFGVVWDVNLSLALLSPLVVLVQIFSRKRLEYKKLIIGLFSFLLLMSPFFLFETRHDFQQTKAVFSSFTTQKDYVPGTGRGYAKLDRVMQLVHTNTTNLFFGSQANLSKSLTLYLLLFAFLLLVYKKRLDWRMAIIFVLWQVLTVGFFTFNSINVSEYYLNGMNVVWIAVFSLGTAELIKNDKFLNLGATLLILFLALNLGSYFSRQENKSGYIERKALVDYINSDAKNHNYPCVAVSYITSVGNDLGYRYFFWLKSMHVNQPESGSPVYTIVYPLSKVSRLDKTFGVLGLVLPDYERYTKEVVNESCSGANSNLTDPMFGYTE